MRMTNYFYSRLENDARSNETPQIEFIIAIIRAKVILKQTINIFTHRNVPRRRVGCKWRQNFTLIF
jgi:hypothetical protein